MILNKTIGIENQLSPQRLALLILLWIVSGCVKKTENQTALNAYPECKLKTSAINGWGWENDQFCIVYESCRELVSDPDGDGWGWENARSCRVTAETASDNAVAFGASETLYETSYYPYSNEAYAKTSCGDARAYGEMYFAVTEGSNLWPESCHNDSWAPCVSEDCLGKWDQMPDDVKMESNGQKLVREPKCSVPCGKKFKLTGLLSQVQAEAVIYDACPSQHWNNRYKEQNHGYNPCAYGVNHVDLRRTLYDVLNNNQTADNIQVVIEPGE